MQKPEDHRKQISMVVDEALQEQSKVFANHITKFRDKLLESNEMNAQSQNWNTYDLSNVLIECIML